MDLQIWFIVASSNGQDCVWPIRKLDVWVKQILEMFMYSTPLRRSKLSLPITDHIVTEFWNWTMCFTTDPAPGECRTGPLSAESFVCLMDPEDANPGQLSVQNPQPTNQGNGPAGPCRVKSSQNILIPLLAAWADGSEFPTHSDEQLARCARGEYNLGVITSSVTVDGAAPRDLQNPILNKVSLSRLPTDPCYIDPPALQRSGVVPPNIEYLSGGFLLNVPNNSLDGQRPNGGSPVGSKRAASHGFWVLLPPLSVGIHTITYNVRVDAPPPIDGTASALAPDIPYPFSSGDITYTLEVP